MKEQIKQITNTKQFHICMLLLIIFTILFVLGLKILEYNTEGDNNPPFEITKISIISSVEGYDVKDNKNKWNLDVNQNNDIYIYIDKNKEYTKTETIKNVKISNFNIIQEPKKGKLILLKPDSKLEKVIFKNEKENEIEQIEYAGATESNIKNMKISNQGGLAAFRYSIQNLGNYKSNKDKEIDHSELLKKIKFNNEDLKFKVQFNIKIELDSKKKYTANAELELPIGDVVNDGTQSLENINLENIKLKRD